VTWRRCLNVRNCEIGSIVDPVFETGI